MFDDILNPTKKQIEEELKLEKDCKEEELKEDKHECDGGCNCKTPCNSCSTSSSDDEEDEEEICEEEDVWECDNDCLHCDDDTCTGC